MQCEIRVRGLLGETLLAAFPGFRATAHEGETVLAGMVPDQSALFGVLAQVEALGLELLEVHRPVSQKAAASGNHSAAPTRDLARDPREGGTDHG